MPFTRSARVAAFALLTGAVWGSNAAAQPETSECAGAYERAQEHRAAAQLTKARDDLVICAQQSCPSFVQSDCVQWLLEVEQEMPSIVFAAKGIDGSDTDEVRVTVDGELFAEQLDGKSKDIDPGKHVFRFEHGEAPSIERQIVIREGEKNRVVEVSFAPVEEKAEPEAPPPAAPPDTIEEDEVGPKGPGPLRPYAFVAGGVGVAGLAGFAVLGLLGKSQESDLEEQCAPNCTEDQLSPVRTKYLLADISGIIGIAGLATGAVLYFLSEPETATPRESSAIRLNVEARRGGGFATMYGRF